ncbi:hypothetical protein AC1031_021666 [Aphanomyces cochlioides]|nr:hypothetical protein AC1031_021666 [Aphanomyces cochlioides]
MPRWKSTRWCMSSLLLSYVFLVFDVQAQGVTLPAAPTTAAPTTTPIPPTTVVPPTTEPAQATTLAPPPTPPSVTPTSVPPTPSTSVPTTTLSTTNIPKQSPSTTTTATPVPSSSDTAVPITQATAPLTTPSTSESLSLTPQPQISETNITNSTIAPATTNATLPPSSTPSSSSLSSGEIAGIIAGAAIFVSFLLYCAIMYWRRRRRRHGMESTLSALASTSGIKEDTLDWGELEHFRVPLDEIELTKSIAAGGFGDVWLGRFRGQVVAVKTCQKSSRKQLQDFIHELVLTGSLQCEEIVTLLGAAWLRPMDLQAILEYMNLGDVKTMLDNSASSPSLWPFHAKLECALSVAKGLVYLKARHVIHRDLKSRNILLDSAKGTKLADFGISRHDTSSETMTAGVGTYRWMAPEVLTFKQYSTSVDVFSFGVVLSELDTHELPYANLRNEVSHGHGYGGRGEILSDSAIMHLVIYKHP